MNNLVKKGIDEDESAAHAVLLLLAGARTK
jgi:hypothetical protein